MKDEKDVANQGQAHSQALEMIKSSGILNPSFTLDKIIDLSSRVAGVATGGTDAVDVFIHSHYIYKHES